MIGDRQKFVKGLGQKGGDAALNKKSIIDGIGEIGNCKVLLS
ncbi:hypothetical protein SPLC1_S033860 [Arthrospira platensis C1]|nr:hypothetical protein SPLC1_S033860 [Arthrospira platensis C1]